MNFKLRRSFFNSFIIKPIGVTTKKNIILIIIGEIILPRIIPNLNQSLLNGFNIFEFERPNSKKINEMIKDQTLIFSWFVNG